MIRSYFRGRTLLVTGGTGFVGSALIAKVLADLGDEVERIYALIRPRRRQDGSEVGAEQRLQQLFETTLFEGQRRDPARWAHLSARVVPVAIDERRADLGLSAEDRRRLVTEVDTIFNSAATVVFDEPLDVSVQANVHGPQALLALAHEAAEAGRTIDFVHVSTAYVNGQRTGAVPDDRLPTDRDMRQIIDGSGPGFDPEAEVADCLAFCEQVRVEAASDEFVRDLKRDILRQVPRRGGRKLTKSRLDSLVQDRRAKWIERRFVDEGMRRGRERGWTDVYTYTKAMGEQLLDLRRGGVPMVFVRPSIIESALSDPEPGWITGLKVMDPMLAAYGRGLIPDFPAKRDVVIDVIPVDLVVNGCLAAATQARADEIEVFHVATGDENPSLIHEMFDSVRAHFERQPMTDMGDDPPKLREWSYPSVRTFRALFHLTYLYPLQVRAWLADRLPEGPGTARRRRMLRSRRVRLQRVLYYIDIYAPYTQLDCRFQTGRTRALFESLPADERETFSLDVTRIDWVEYIERIHLPGMRRHVLRDTIDDDAVLPESRQEPGAEEARLQEERDVATIPDLVRAACIRDPAATAIERVDARGQTETLSYGTLLERIEARAGAWQALGLSAGDRVVLATANGPEWVVHYLGASFLGAAVVPVDPQVPAAELGRMAAYVEARAVVAATDRLGQIDAAEWDGLRLDVVTGAPSEGALPAAPFEEPDLAADAEASIIFTCGVRVDPRAVVLTHENFLSDVMGLCEVQPLEPADRLLSLLPLHHGLEFTGGLLLSLWSGASTVYLEAPLNSRRILDAIRERGITALLAVPRILKIVAERVRRLDGDDPAAPNAQLLRRLRLVVSGGAPLASDLYDTWAGLGIEIHEGYGLTEAAPIVSVNPAGASRPGSVGVPLPGAEVRIDDEGEILVRGPMVMRGYLNRPDLTDQVLRDGWLHTGDEGRLDDEGYLTITGRRRELIVTGAGKNVYPAEVEALYADLPGVDELAVVGVPSARTLGEEVHGVAVLGRAAREVDVEAAAEEVRQQVYAISRDLPPYQRIARLHVRQRPLPRRDDGHVDREALRVDLDTAEAAQVDIADSLAPWERAIYQRVSELAGLSLAEVVAHADAPLDTMLDSLMAAELAGSVGRGIALERHETTLRQFVDRLDPAHTHEAAVAYWSDALGGNGATSSSRAPAATRWTARWRAQPVVATGQLPTGPCLLAARATADSVDGLLAWLRRQTENLCVLFERREDVPEGRRIRRLLADAVILEDHGSLEEGLRQAARRLAPGQPLLLFPEGLRVSPEGQRGESGRGAGHVKSGVGLLAHELGVPVVPLHARLAQGRVQLRIGAPVEVPVAREGLTAYERYREIAGQVRGALRDLSERTTD